MWQIYFELLKVNLQNLSTCLQTEMIDDDQIQIINP